MTLRIFFVLIRWIRFRYLKAINEYRLAELRHVYRDKFIYGDGLHCITHFRISLDESNSMLKIGRNFSIRNNCYFLAENDGKILIGDDVFMNNSCSINSIGGSIEIGRNCLLGENVKIYNHNHTFKDPIPIRKQNYDYADIVIGENCWIGSDVILLKGARIGNNCVIGAQCIVKRNIPPNSVVQTTYD